MSTTLNRGAFAQLVAEDLAWLETQPRTLERDHVAVILRAAVDVYYPPATAPAAPIARVLEAWRTSAAAYRAEGRRDATQGPLNLVRFTKADLLETCAEQIEAFTRDRELAGHEAADAVGVAIRRILDSGRLERNSDRRLLDTLILDCHTIADKVFGQDFRYLRCLHCKSEGPKAGPINHGDGCVVGQILAILKERDARV